VIHNSAISGKRISNIVFLRRITMDLNEIIDFSTKEAATYVVVTLKSGDMMRIINELQRLQAEIEKLKVKVADYNEDIEIFIQKTIG